MSSSFIVVLSSAYLLGAMPWSVWLSRRFAGIDPRDFSDGNPGAANSFRGAGKRIGLAVVGLDYLKAFLPVIIAQEWFDFSGVGMLAIALAPTLGHAFSVFLGMHGGRGLITFFGVWSGLTLYRIPMVMGMGAILASFMLKNDEARSLAVPTTALMYLLMIGAEWWMIATVIGQLIILLSKIGVYIFSRQNIKVSKYVA